jgi:hypothetical protein
MVRTIIDGVYSSTFFSNLAQEVVVNRLDHAFREIAARNSGLVGNDNGKPPVVVEQLNGLGGVREYAKAGWMVYVANLFGNCAITVDENCGPPHATAPVG